MAVWNAKTESATESSVELAMVAGVASVFRLNITPSQTAGNLYTGTVLKNGVATALTCQIAASSQTCNDSTHTVAFAAGDRISVQVTHTGTPSAVIAAWTARYLIG